MPTDTGRRSPIAQGGRGAGHRARRLNLSETIAALTLLAIVFLGVVAFGASDVATASVMAGLYPLYLLGLLATCDWARRDLGRLSGLPLQAALFAVLVGAVLWPLAPWGFDGPHPVWSYLPGQPRSITVDRSALLFNALQLFGLACLFLSARVVGASKARGSWFIRAAVIGLGVYAALAFADHVGVRRTPRLTATLLSPNSAATIFGAGLLLAVAAAINRFRRYPGLTVLRRGDPEVMAWLSLVGLLATVLLLTLSRAGLVASLVGLGLLLAWNAFAQRQSLRGAAGLVAMASVILIAALALRSLGGVVDRFSVAERDLEIRSNIFGAHWDAFLAAPWNGFGLGSFPAINQLIVDTTTLSMLHDVRAAHNLYLQWLEEGGVIGAAAMLALFLALMLPIGRAGLADKSNGIWARATVCAAIVFLLHGVTDFALQVPAIQALCAMILGVVSGMVFSTPAPRRPQTAAWLWPTAGLAAMTTVASALFGAPLMAAKLGGDLSSWPTAPADALAQSVETGLEARATPAALRRLDRLSARELALRPASGSAWLRRAAVDSALGREEEASLALERSFQVAPLQTSLFNRRTTFAYEHWDRLTQTAREQTVYALKTEWRRDNRPARFVTMANAVHNPAGRVGFALQIAVLRARPIGG